MNPDLINGSFETLGAIAIVFNIVQIIKDKEIKGQSMIPLIFFT